jgi:hypothetical protein
MRKDIVLVDYKQGFLVENKRLREKLFETFSAARSEGGLYIIGSPAHTGKSVSLQEALNAYKREGSCGGDVKYIKAISVEFEKLTMELFKTSLGIPADKLMKDFLPAGSLIVIDQFNASSLSDSEKDLFTKLATSSFNFKTFAVIVSVSNVNTYKQLLQLNQGHKVFAACDPRLFHFSEDMMMMKQFMFITRFSSRGDDDECVSEASTHQSVGVLRSESALVNSTRSNGFHISSEDAVDVDWGSFEAVYDQHQ